MVTIEISLLDGAATVPAYATSGDAGCDLVAIESVRLEPRGGRGVVRTGVALAIPEGFAGFIQPRSGLALRHGVTCLNTPGLIDSGYRGEIKVLLINTDPTAAFEIAPGERIAQLVIQKVEQAEFAVVAPGTLSSTERGTQGFGSTGR